MGVGTGEILEWHLEDLVDLGLLSAPCRRRAVQAAEKRRYPKAGGHRLDDRQRRQNFDPLWLEPDFFFGLTQRGRQQICILRLAAPTREGNLSAVNPMRSATDEHQPQSPARIAV